MQNDNFGAYQPERKSYTADDLGYSKRGSLLKNPVVATLILLVTAGIFAALILYVVPGSDDQDVLPVIRAEVDPYKTEPEDAGGAEILNHDSTIFAEMRDDVEDSGQIENLLAGQGVPEDSKPEAEVVVRDITAQQGGVPDKPEALHPAGASPETIAFVKSVLEKQEQDQEQADADAPAPAPEKTKAAPEAKPADVTPAVKAEAAPTAAKPAASASTGTHYVQISSITDESKAAAEWAKIQKKYPALAGEDYRVQRKDIEGKGTFYRIQAGPFSKDVASGKCEMIKAASGGCFLVAK